MNDDLYRTLNVEQEATTEEIQRAYRALARRYHPDLNASTAAAEVMPAINKAYEVLSDPWSRARYDRGLTNRQSELDVAILGAARENVLRNDWVVLEDSAGVIVMKNAQRRMRVALTAALNATGFNQVLQRAAEFTAVLAVRIDPPIPLRASSAALIDLMHSQLYAGTFPDAGYRDLFKMFLSN